MCMCMCIYIYIYTYIHTYTYIYTIYIYTYIYIYIYMMREIERDPTSDPLILSGALSAQGQTGIKYMDIDIDRWIYIDTIDRYR